MVKSINYLLENILDSQVHWKINILKNWDAIIGSISSHAHIEKITHDTITIGVYDACWLQELHHLSHTIIQNINAHLDTPRIKQVRFKQVSKPKGLKKTKSSNHFIRSSKQGTLSSKHLEALNKITDHDLAQALKKFWFCCVQER